MESLSAMECALIKERTLVGLHKARENGKVGGRPKSMDAPSAKSVHYIMKTKKQSNLFLINAAFRWALVISTSIYLRQMSSGCILRIKRSPSDGASFDSIHSNFSATFTFLLFSIGNLAQNGVQ